MTTYELWRQDDNGQRFMVGSWPAREDAAREAEQLEGRGHKQTYYVVEIAGSQSTPGAALDLSLKVGEGDRSLGTRSQDSGR